MLFVVKNGTTNVAANNNAQNSHDSFARGILISVFIIAYVAANISSQMRRLCGTPNAVIATDPIRKCTYRKSSEFWPKN